MTDVAVVGGSIGGLSTALELLKHRIDVDVYEKEKGIGSNVVCGGGILSFRIKEAKMVIPDYTIASRIKKVKIFAPTAQNFKWSTTAKVNIGQAWNSEKCWSIKSGNDDYVVILYRDRYERYLADQVLLNGGKIHLNNPIKDPVSLLKDHHHVVCADGLLGASTRFLGPLNREDVALCIQCVTKSDIDDVQLYFGRTVPEAYAWMFPIGDGCVRVGLGVPLSFTRTRASMLLYSFMEEKNLRPISEIKGKVIPVSKPPNQLVFNSIYLVGDAAHLCDPLTGSGIASAIISGKACARAIAENSPQNYWKYTWRIRRRNNIQYALRQVLSNMSDNDFCELIDGLNHYKPKEIRSLNTVLFRGMLALTLHKPRLIAKHKMFRKLLRGMFA